MYINHIHTNNNIHVILTLRISTIQKRGRNELIRKDRNYTYNVHSEIKYLVLNF